MDNIFIYPIDAPTEIGEMVSPCLDGYTVYINQRLSNDGRKRAYRHALNHIRNNDFEGIGSVDEIESNAHI